MLEKTKSQEKKVKENIYRDSQKTNSKNLAVVKNDELINIEKDTTKNSDVEFVIKPIDEEIKNIVHDFSQTE